MMRAAYTLALILVAALPALAQETPIVIEAGKVVMVARVPDLLIKRGLKAGNWIKHVASLCGGGGGGRPDMAQAGGSKPECAREAAADGTSWAKEQLT